MRNIKQTVFLRLFVTFLLVMAPIYAIGFSIYNWGVRAIRTELGNSMTAQAAFYLNGLATEMQRVQVLQYDCITDDSLNGLTYAAASMDNFERAQALLRLQQRLYSVKNSSEYIEDVAALIAPLDTTVSAMNGIKKGLDETAIRTLGYPGISPASQIKYNEGRFYSNVKNVYTKTSRAPFAYLVTVTLSGARIESELTQFGAYRGSVTLLTCENNGFLFASAGAGGQAEALRRSLALHSAGKASGSYFETIGGRRHVAVFARNEYLGFVLARIIPEGELLSSAKDYQLWLWAFIVSSLIIIALFSLSVYSSIHKPLRTMVTAFKQVEGGNFNIHIEHRHSDEFRYLYGGFNGMVRNIGTLIDQAYRQKILAQNAQLKQLQAQINPHFLYNTFFILTSMAEAEDLDSVKLFLRQLGSYFKYITRSGEDEVKLSREVEHARLYAGIQELRFSRRVKVDFAELPERFAAVPVPRLILQPIIENAFKYGLEDKESGGVLRVAFREEGALLLIDVDDNGAGVAPEELDKMRAALSAAQPQGETTGIANIHWRLRLKFGGGSGLSVSANDMGGLRVTIAIDPGEGQNG